MKALRSPSILESLEAKVAPAHTALLIVDMLNDFIDPAGKTATRGKRPIEFARAVIPAQQRLLSEAREQGVLVVHVVYSTLEDGLSDSGPWIDAKLRATFSVRDLAMEGSWGQQVIAELAPVNDELIVKKHRFSGFVGTDLDLLLRSRGVATTIVCGVSTNVCVEATARDAFSHEYYVVLPPDACASWDVELHNASLKTAAHRYAVVPTVDELLDTWRVISAKAPAR